MIKVDIISGFLGAGKTTLIRYIAKALMESGERVVIVENEFGEVGIDGKMLEQQGLDVFEITNGCLCCTVKTDFISTLRMIAEEVRPDRVLIEPSGIFVPADVFDIFKVPEIASSMRINAQINVLDSIHYLKQRIKYAFFFENQIRFAKRIVMSKTETLTGETLSIIQNEIHKINPRLPVQTKAWNLLSPEELIALLSSDDSILEADIGKIDANPKTQTNLPASNSMSYRRTSQPRNTHRSFSSFTFTPQKHFTEASLRQLLESLSDLECGTTLRAKGFVRTGRDGTLLHFDYVDRTIDIVLFKEAMDPTVYFIGDNLDKEALLKLF
jgi:G3E family GTPase